MVKNEYLANNEIYGKLKANASKTRLRLYLPFMRQLKKNDH